MPSRHAEIRKLQRELVATKRELKVVMLRLEQMEKQRDHYRKMHDQLNEGSLSHSTNSTLLNNINFVLLSHTHNFSLKKNKVNFCVFLQLKFENRSFFLISLQNTNDISEQLKVK